MTYILKLFIENYWYQVYTQGQCEEPLFFSPLDWLSYLTFLRRFGCFRDIFLDLNGSENFGMENNLNDEIEVSSGRTGHLSCFVVGYKANGMNG